MRNKGRGNLSLRKWNRVAVSGNKAEKLYRIQLVSVNTGNTKLRSNEKVTELNGAE
jgi:hypothetical protein